MSRRAVGIDAVAPLRDGARARLVCPWCWEHFNPTATEWTYCSARCREQRAAAYERLDDLAVEGRVEQASACFDAPEAGGLI